MGVGAGVTRMRELGYPIEMVRGVPVVTAPEEIDIINARQLRSALLSAVSHSDGPIVVDMRQTRFCDVAGLHALVAAHNCAQAEHGAMLLVIPAAAVLRVLALTGVDCLIPNFTSLGEALAYAGESTGRSATSGRLRGRVTGLAVNPGPDPDVKVGRGDH
jgi:anti-sigma B factor antagonist